MRVCGDAGPVAGSRPDVDRRGAVDGVVEHRWGGRVTNTQDFWIFPRPQDSEAESLEGSWGKRVSGALPTQDSPGTGK